MYIIKSLAKSDSTLLEDMLYYAIYTGAGEPPSKSIIYEPQLYKYIRDWGAENDFGYKVIDGKTNNIMGAVWARYFQSEEKGYGYINSEIPELSISLYPEYRGKGAGTALLNHLLNNLPLSTRYLSLSVNLNNPAYSLYKKLGFQDYKIEGDTTVMLIDRINS